MVSLSQSPNGQCEARRAAKGGMQLVFRIHRAARRVRLCVDPCLPGPAPPRSAKRRGIGQETTSGLLHRQMRGIRLGPVWGLGLGDGEAGLVGLDS